MKHIKILSLGDDSLRVALTYLPKIAKCDSAEVISGVLYAEELQKDSLLQKIKSNAEDFNFVYNNEGSVRFNTAEKFSAAKAFDWFDWDYVVIPDYGRDFVDELCAFVESVSPETEVVVNRTFSSAGKELLFMKNNTTFSVSDISELTEKAVSDSCFSVDAASGRVKDFILSCVLYETIIGNNIADNKYRLPFVEREITEIVKNVVHDYCAKVRTDVIYG